MKTNKSSNIRVDTYGYAERRRKKNDIKIESRTLLDLYMEKNAMV